jgi:hypothetical protein
VFQLTFDVARHPAGGVEEDVRRNSDDLGELLDQMVRWG